MVDVPPDAGGRGGHAVERLEEPILVGDIQITHQLGERFELERADQVVLDWRMVGIHRFNVVFLRVASTQQAGRRRAVTVDDIELRQLRERGVDWESVLAVEGVGERANGDFVLTGAVATVGVDDVHLVAAGFEPLSPRLDRVRYPIDTGKVAIGEKPDFHLLFFPSVSTSLYHLS